MFVYYLDGCLTPYWKLLTLGIWVVTLFFIALQVRGLMRAAAVGRSLKASNITGEAYERMRPNPGRHLRHLTVWTVLSIAILVGYTSFFSSFVCTPDSFLYIAPQYGY